jgi:hypothetical protein
VSDRRIWRHADSDANSYVNADSHADTLVDADPNSDSDAISTRWKHGVRLRR